MKRRTPAVMVQGTGSDVGKSLLVAGMARAFARRGLKVRPFKPQNMSNNAAVTIDGGEIGRAQALQARASGVDPITDMNPVLLKPETEVGAQVVVQGRRVATLQARDYAAFKPGLMGAVLDSYHRLAAQADLMLVEGAGSPAEVNLRAGDIANMGFAEAADLPVILAADIDRGGVIASLVGTWAVIPEAERRRIRAYVINKFRGDVRLFDSGLTIITDHTGWQSLGVVPHWPQARCLPAEDAVALSHLDPSPDRPIRIAVPVFSRIANFDDLDPLRLEPDVAVAMVPAGQPLPGDADLIILPGSKSTIGDLAFFRSQGWDIDLAAHVRRGGHVLGLCGGYQMMGCRLDDPDGIEGLPGAVEGLGLLDAATTLTADKTLVEVAGRHIASGQAVRGYEMHVGRTTGPALARPLLDLAGRPEGAQSPDGRIAGCYIHGMFAADGFRHAFLAALKPRADGGVAYDATIDATLDALARHLETHMDLDSVLAIAGYR
ncbi:MAG: cobyric acid synthase [Rhodospirillaceae bacterium]|nr:cobyric acid synthase [Rhodospirillaceae bacterium]